MARWISLRWPSGSLLRKREWITFRRPVDQIYVDDRRTGLVTSILCHLIGPICCFKVMENNFVWGRLFSGLKWQKIGSKVITDSNISSGINGFNFG
jgi:hypothetical protein